MHWLSAYSLRIWAQRLLRGKWCCRRSASVPHRKTWCADLTAVWPLTTQHYCELGVWLRKCPEFQEGNVWDDRTNRRSAIDDPTSQRIGNMTKDEPRVSGGPMKTQNNFFVLAASRKTWRQVFDSRCVCFSRCRCNLPSPLRIPSRWLFEYMQAAFNS